MINKIVDTPAAALAGVRDGSTVLVSGFGEGGMAFGLIDALLEQGATDLTLVMNNAGNAEYGVAALMKAGRVRKVVCSFPRQTDSWVFDGLYRAGKLELELVPQGTLAERIRAAGAGVPAFFTPTASGTALANGKEVREFDGRPHVLEHAIRGDVALVGAYKGDRWGNLTYRMTSRNFGPIMATAATLTIAQVREIVPLGALDPETVVTPGIYVNRVVQFAHDRRRAAA